MENNWRIVAQNPFSNSPKTNTSFFGGNTECGHIFHSIPDDFGRESLGIFDVNHPDFGRESLGFLDGGPRESLGILNLNDINLGRDSLGIMSFNFVSSQGNLPPLIETDSVTKSSAQSLNLNEVPETCVMNNTSLLNNAFIHHSPSVNSSISSRPSFHSASLENSFLSRIVSTPSDLTDIMNDAFLETLNLSKQVPLFIRRSTSTCSPLDKKQILRMGHKRFSSVSSALQVNNPGVSQQTESGNLEQDCMDDLTDDEFRNSVFIEAKHIADRIADGSILESDECDNDMLDSTREPDEFVAVDTEDIVVKYDIETVVNAVDKLFKPEPKEENLNRSIKKEEKSDNSCRSSKSSSSKSREAIELINTLSEILSENPNDKQKNDGQILLSSLAEIFLSSASTKSGSCILDDSGHSSIESEPAAISEHGQIYEVLDLSKKSASATNVSHLEPEICEPLDLSMKSKSMSLKVLSQKLNQNQKLINTKNSFTSNYSGSSNDSKNFVDLTRKFRPKKTEVKQSTVKKGPMKAVLPVDNMAKSNNSNGSIQGPGFSRLKKTSTPINVPNLKPMAQSTPDNSKSGIPTSPFTSPNTSLHHSPKMLKSKLSYSRKNATVNRSLDSINTEKYPLLKKGSNDLRKTQITQKPFTRSYSVGEKLMVRKIATNIKQTAQRSSFTQSKTETKTSGSALKENVRRSIGKPAGQKKIGKENMHY